MNAVRRTGLPKVPPGLGTQALCAVLHCPHWRIEYLLRSRRVPRPLALNGRRHFTTRLILKIRRELDLDLRGSKRIGRSK